jgi:hypothetical protein
MIRRCDERDCELIWAIIPSGVDGGFMGELIVPPRKCPRGRSKHQRTEGAKRKLQRPSRTRPSLTDEQRWSGGLPGGERRGTRGNARPPLPADGT